MSFLNPMAFLWTGLLAAGLISLYLLRMRRRDLQVPATFLWPERTDEVRANSLFQKLRFSWLLVLQLLALAMVGFAWAQPQMVQRGLGGEVTAIILDASASMTSTETGRTRFEDAVRQADSLIAAAKPGDRICLILAGPTPRVIFPLTSDKPKQRAALRTVTCTEADAPMSEALQLAAALVGSSKGARIVVLSDGVFAPIEDFSSGEAAVSYVQIGKPAENLGIEAFGSSDSQNGPLLYAAVRNYGAKTQKATLRLFADGKLIDSINFSANSNESWSHTLAAPAEAKVFRAEIENGGSLAADDSAFTLANAAGQIRVLLVSPGNLFLERALSLEPNVVLDKAASVPESEKAGSDNPTVYNMVIFDAVPASPVKAQGVLVFGSPGTGGIVNGSRSAARPTFLAKKDHPVMDGVDLDGVYVESMKVVSPVGGAQVVAESQEGPLVVVQEGVRRQVYVSFTILESDFPLSVSFPIFLANAIEFLGGREGQAGYLVQPGRSIAVNTETDLELTGPDGKKSKVAARDGRAVIRDLNQVGEWRIAGGELKKPIFVSLKSPQESTDQPKDAISIPGKEMIQGHEGVRRLADVWKPLAILALLILAAEWLLFARRS